AVELHQVAVPGRHAADQVVLHAWLIGLGRPQGGVEAVGAAQDDAVQQVADRGGAVGTDAGEVALDDVALAAVIHFDASAVEAHAVTGAAGGAADGVVVAAGNLDAEEAVALGRTGSRWAGPVADRAGAGGIDAGEVAFDEVVGSRGGQGADDMD